MTAYLLRWRHRLFAFFAIVVPNMALFLADKLGVMDWTLWVNPKWVPLVSVIAGLAVISLREYGRSHADEGPH